VLNGFCYTLIRGLDIKLKATFDVCAHTHTHTHKHKYTRVPKFICSYFQVSLMTWADIIQDPHFKAHFPPITTPHDSSEHSFQRAKAWRKEHMHRAKHSAVRVQASGLTRVCDLDLLWMRYERRGRGNKERERAVRVRPSTAGYKM